jgi:hypothetical protein
VLAAPPPPTEAPPSPDNTVERPSWFKWGYGHIGGILSPYGAGLLSLYEGNPDLTSKFSGGIHLSGYWAVSTNFQLGAYFNFVKGRIEFGGGGENDVEHIGTGVSVKSGGRVGNRVWLGGVADLGFYKLSFDGVNESFSVEGIEISPRFHMDVLIVRAGEFKMGFFATVGPSMVMLTTIQGNKDYIWLITIQLRLGLTFGA